MKQPEIFIHVGMGRAGSTFLQYQVFPKMKGIKYVQRTRFRKAKKIIAKGKHDKFLVSGELDNRIIEKYLIEFSNPYSYARPILVIRRHDEWIASQYRRYLKNGNHWSFTEFFDLENDGGYWKKAQLFYYPVLELLEKYFQYKPLILMYDDLKKDPEKFIERIVQYCGADIDINRINLSPRHVSYNSRQLETIYRISGRINLRKKRPFKKKWKNVLVNLQTNALRYLVLYSALLVPSRKKSSRDIFPTIDQLSAIRKFYDPDWERCVTYFTALSVSPKDL